ncbi:MAG: hypothetical protein HOV87_13865 [Catenulispora sp.]|nr:hypothetical protein [Catenulispora sp.]
MDGRTACAKNKGSYALQTALVAQRVDDSRPHPGVFHHSHRMGAHSAAQGLVETTALVDGGRRGRVRVRHSRGCAEQASGFHHASPERRRDGTVCHHDRICDSGHRLDTGCTSRHDRRNGAGQHRGLPDNACWVFVRGLACVIGGTARDVQRANSSGKHLSRDD